MTLGRKRALVGLAVLLATAAIYAGAVQLYFWKWESPHDPLPSGHLDVGEHIIHNEHQADLADQIHQAMGSLAANLQTVSITGAVAIDGEPSWAGTVGLAQVENGAPATTESRYRIGSISKSLTGTTLVRMAELGMIDLDAEIQTYLPDYPRHDTPMTVRQLASHMAGIRHYGFDATLFPPHDFYLDEHFDDVANAVTFFKDDDLLFSPGHGFSYSTYGYTLLSAVMQAAANKPFLTVMDELLLEPLGMQATGAEDRDGDLTNIVSFYTAEKGLYGATPDVDVSIKYAGGGFLSTPTDMVTFASALLNDRLLSPQARETLFTPEPMFDGSPNPQGYALGWRHYETIHILGEDKPVDVVHHGGASSGAAAFLLMVPDHNIAVAFMSNGRSDETRLELQMLAYKVAAMIIDQQR